MSSSIDREISAPIKKLCGSKVFLDEKGHTLLGDLKRALKHSPD